MDVSPAAVVEGSMEGLLTAVYAYYHENLRPSALYDRDAPAIQETIGQTLIRLETDAEKAARVWEAMEAKFTADTRYNVVRAMASHEKDKLFDVYRYILLAFKVFGKVDAYERFDYVLRVHKLVRNVSSEAHHLKGFTRFKKTLDGVFYAQVSPKNNVLPQLCEHFMDRLGSQPWVIHDMNRGLAGAFDPATDECVIAEIGDIKPQFTETADERGYQELWTAFYRTIGIQERKNSKLRRQNSPKYFWKHMTEHNLRFYKE